jgi:hypothetical protein
MHLADEVNKRETAEAALTEARERLVTSEMVRMDLESDLATMTEERDAQERTVASLVKSVNDADHALEAARAEATKAEETLRQIRTAYAGECGCDDHAGENCCNQAKEPCAFCLSSAAIRAPRQADERTHADECQSPTCKWVPCSPPPPSEEPNIHPMHCQRCAETYIPPDILIAGPDCKCECHVPSPEPARDEPRE